MLKAAREAAFVLPDSGPGKALAGLKYLCPMKKKSGFEKFYDSGVKKGAAKKEQLRQEKRAWKKERSEKIEAKKRQFREQAAAETPAPQGPKIIRKVSDDLMPLNKFIAHCGVCSRRDAVDLIKAGKVKVNDEVVVEPGHKVSPKDIVIFGSKRVQPVRDMVYILLNKPKDYLTTTDDPQKRKTVLDLIAKATKERVYPVGRLDRNTSGVLLLTNDGDLSQKLTHPSNEIKKVYAVTLDKPLTKQHFDEILKGVPLEDGVVNVDVLAYADNADKTQIGIELHTGRNRVVRRISSTSATTCVTSTA
jgi:23S rRNA pseudouridine2605 synthase